MKIIITEDQKNKLFIPRKLSGEGSRWEQWNKEQPIKDGVRINQYDLDGNKTGYWEEYFDEDGNYLISKGNYINGIPNGYWEYFHENGVLEFEGMLKDNERDGIWVEYYDDGKLYCRGEYKNGEQVGVWNTYHNNGKLKSNGKYKNGYKNGIWKWYHLNGELITVDLFGNDRVVEELPLTESDNKKKLFIPRKIDEREVEAEKLKQKFISEIKEIIEEEGSIDYDELDGDSVMYTKDLPEYITAFITKYNIDDVEITTYLDFNGLVDKEFNVPYEELNLQQLMEIRELLETYESH